MTRTNREMVQIFLAPPAVMLRFPFLALLGGGGDAPVPFFGASRRWRRCSFKVFLEPRSSTSKDPLQSPICGISPDDKTISSSQQEDSVAKDNKVHSEIEEINENTSEVTESLDESDNKVSGSPVNQLVDVPANKEKFVIHSEVRQALGTLEKAISIIRDFGYNLETSSVSGNATVKSLGVEEDEQKDTKLSEKDRIHGSGIARAELPKQRNSSASHGSSTSSSLCTREANHIKKIAPASPDDYVGTLGNTQHAAARTSTDRSKEDNVTSVRANTVPGKKNGKRKKKLPFTAACIFNQDKSGVKRERNSAHRRAAIVYLLLQM